jgi:hypothetical protein
MGRERRVLQETAARQLPLCPFNDRVDVAMQYVAKGPGAGIGSPIRSPRRQVQGSR